MSNTLRVTFETPRVVVRTGPAGHVRVQAGPVLNAVQPGGVDCVAGSTLLRGQPVAVQFDFDTGNYDAVPARADQHNTVFGLVTTNCDPGDLVRIQTDGIFTLTDWTTIAGSRYLQTGARYNLSTTPGRITVLVPNATGTWVVPVGYALSTTDFQITHQNAVGN